MMRRTASLLALFALAACGLESSGQAPRDDGGGIVDVYVDRGSGVTDSGTKCGCLPSPGAGWSFIAYQRDGAPACGGSFSGTPRVAVEATGAAPTCTCACAGTGNPTCTPSALSVAVHTNNNCGGGPDKTITPDPGCYDVNPDYKPNGAISAKGTATVTVTGGTCGAPVPQKTVPPPDVHTGGACALVAALGSGCGVNDSCVPDPPAGLSVCVMSDVPNAKCPPGYTVNRSVGSAFTDSRDCAPACSCAQASTCTVQGQFHMDMCGGAKLEGMLFALDGTCRPVSNAGVDAHALEIKTTVVNKCNSQGYQPTGAVTPSGGFTICCP